MKIRRFVPADVQRIALQPAQAGVVIPPDSAAMLALTSEAYTGEVEGRVVAIVGAQRHNAHRAEGWALLAADLGANLLTVTRAVRGWLAQGRFPRVDITVATDFPEALRWARVLGFQQEGPQRPCYTASGGAAVTFVRLHGRTDNLDGCGGGGVCDHRGVGGGSAAQDPEPER